MPFILVAYNDFVILAKINAYQYFFDLHHIRWVKNKVKRLCLTYYVLCI